MTRLTFLLLVLSATAGTLSTLFGIAVAIYMSLHSHPICLVVHWNYTSHNVCVETP